MRVVLVEDDRSMRVILSTFFRTIGVEVLASPVDGQEALELLETLQPDVIITDWHMPRVDGISMVRQLRERGNQTPVIIMSGHADVELQDLARDVGVSQCLRKPLSLDTLSKAIQQTLQNTAA